MQITARLGSRTPVITNAVTGIIGLDAHLDEICEVCMHHQYTQFICVFESLVKLM